MNAFAFGTPRNVGKNKLSLVYTDLIQESDEHYEFLDPAFELWFNKQFFKNPCSVWIPDSKKPSEN